MKKLLILALMFLGGNSVLASGIDWQRSVMRVEYEAESAFSPDFNCFQYTESPDTGLTPPEIQYPRNPDTPNAFIAGCGDPYDTSGGYDYCVWEFLDVLGYSDEENNPPIENCFQQSGNYKTSIYLIDYADNVTGPDVGLFSIKPGPPDPETSEFQLDSACSDESLIANGSDTCTITFKIKDQFGNPVTQLKGETGTIYSDGAFCNDANSGDYNFRTGTRINGSEIPTSATPEANECRDTSIPNTPESFAIGNNNEVSSTFTLTSWTPSMSKVGEYLGLTESFNYAFHIETSTVDEDGDLDTGNKIEYEFGQYTPAVAFAPWVKSIPNLDMDPAVFLLNTEVPLNLARNLFSAATGGPNASVNIFLTYHLSLTGSYFGGDDVNESDYTVTFHDQSSDVIDIYTEKQSTTILPILKLDDVDSSVVGDLGFSSEIAYNITDNGTKNIRYPSGAIGNNIPDSSGGDDLDDGITIQTGILGVSVEGKIIGDKDKQLLGDDKSIRLDVNSIDDIREEIFFNSNKLTRGIEPQTTVLDVNHASPYGGSNQRVIYNTNWFNNHNVALVENRDVVIQGSQHPPSGTNTLLIKNGNLIIRDDFTYTDKLDSFGIILINDEVEEKPEEGNIFIENDINKFVGNIFAEGSIFTIPTGISGDIDINDVTNGHKDASGNPINETQLLFTGTLLTHNTLGGAVKVEGDTTYFTPWGTTSDIETSDFDEAKKYDLHYIRAYAPKYTGTNQNNGDKCACEEGGTCTTNPAPDCDDNIHAMIVRYDGKVSSSPPPGFRESALIQR